MADQVRILVDWENARKSLQDQYIERVEVEEIMVALEKLGRELGVLDKVTFYSDFTLRRDEARKIQSKPRFDPHSVLRSESQKDRCDEVIVADIMELLHSAGSPAMLVLCAGDSGYCDIVRRAEARGKRVYICFVSGQVSRELSSLVPFYPLEKYLERKLTPRSAAPQTLEEPSVSPREFRQWAKFVTVLDRLEGTLPAIHLSYLQNQIMPSYGIGGLSSDDRYAYVETAREQGLIFCAEIEDNRRPGRSVMSVRLNRENPLVKAILLRK